MKKIIYSLFIFTGSTLCMLSSCKKSDSVATPATTVSTIKNDPSLSIFAAIESRSGDNDYVNNSGAIVVPVDSAFISAGITASVAAALSPAECDSIVKYYAIPNGINFNGSNNAEISFTSDLGSSLYADSTGTALYVDGVAAASQTPTVVGTTSIYKLTGFVSPPAISVSQVIAADTSLSLFNEAFARANLAASLTGGNFTLFMPNNSAFINAGFADIASIDAADINTLTQILLYHVVANNYFDNDLSAQSSLTTLQGGALQVNNNGGLQVIGNADPLLPAHVLNNGIIAGNVLTYKINNVLLP